MEKVIPDRLKPYRSLWEGVGQTGGGEQTLFTCDSEKRRWQDPGTSLGQSAWSVDDLGGLVIHPAALRYLEGDGRWVDSAAVK